MRKYAFALFAASLMLFAGVFTAEAMTGSRASGLRSAAKNLSPIDTVACRVAGPACRYGRTLVCRPLRGCWCARCWR
jgi:hypothetical protein